MTLPRPPIRWLLAALALVAAVVAVAVIAAGPDAKSGAARAATGAATTAEPASGSDDSGVLAPLPAARPKVVEPVAGRGSDNDADPAAAVEDDSSLPKPKGPATVSSRPAGHDSGVRDLQADKATALPNGVALPPLEAPEQVLNVIRAGNIIAKTPYKWGGGHGRFQDSGYDCSGSVSYALYYAGLIAGPHASGDLMRYGRPGKGRWITLYANGGHVFMEVAGIRFDTSGARVTGSRWQNEIRTTAGFAVRHPPGL